MSANGPLYNFPSKTFFGPLTLLTVRYCSRFIVVFSWDHKLSVTFIFISSPCLSSDAVKVKRWKKGVLCTILQFWNEYFSLNSNGTKSASRSHLRISLGHTNHRKSFREKLLHRTIKHTRRFFCQLPRTDRNVYIREQVSFLVIGGTGSIT